MDTSPWGTPHAKRGRLSTPRTPTPGVPKRDPLRIHVRGLCSDCGQPLHEPSKLLCPACREAALVKRTAYKRAHHAATYDNRVAHDRHLRRTYGITLAEYDALLAAQGGVCAVCGRDGKGGRLAVDHDHTSRKLRALLCHNCNRAIGLFQDNPDLLDRAAAYPRAHSV